MNPGRIAGANFGFGAPEGWNAAEHGECCTLPVLNTGKILQSAWFPSPEELAALNSGCPVILNIFARQHPVVAIGVSPVPEGAERMCDHGKTVVQGCEVCSRDDPAERARLERIRAQASALIVPPVSRKKQ